MSQVYYAQPVKEYDTIRLNRGQIQTCMTRLFQIKLYLYETGRHGTTSFPG